MWYFIGPKQVYPPVLVPCEKSECEAMPIECIHALCSHLTSVLVSNPRDHRATSYLQILFFCVCCKNEIKMEHVVCVIESVFTKELKRQLFFTFVKCFNFVVSFVSFS